MFQLGKHGPVKGGTHRAGALVARRSCCRRPTSTASASTSSSRRSPRRGFSSQAFAPHYPAHRAQDRDQDLHRLPRLAAERQQRDHGAAPAAGHQLRELRGLQRLGRRGAPRRRGAGDRVGRAAGGDRQLPAQATPIRTGSQQHQKRDSGCRWRTIHGTRGPAACLQLRGEYLTSPRAPGGFRVYDVASIANKGVSQKFITAPFSPLGQDTRVASTNATCVALPTNQADQSRCATRATSCASTTRSSRSTRSTAMRWSPTRSRA